MVRITRTNTKTGKTKKWMIVGALSASLLPSLSAAAIPGGQRDYRVTKPRIAYQLKRDFSKGLDASKIEPLCSTRDFTPNDIGRIIPQTLEPTSDSGAIATQILDHSLSSFFNLPQVRNSDLGRAAESVEKTVEGDVSFGGQEPTSTRHSLKFAMKAAQTKAQLEYTGVTDAQLSYIVAAQTLNLEVKENFDPLKSQFVYHHTASQADRRDMLSLRWNW